MVSRITSILMGWRPTCSVSESESAGGSPRGRRAVPPPTPPRQRELLTQLQQRYDLELLAYFHIGSPHSPATDPRRLRPGCALTSMRSVMWRWAPCSTPVTGGLMSTSGLIICASWAWTCRPAPARSAVLRGRHARRTNTRSRQPARVPGPVVALPGRLDLQLAVVLVVVALLSRASLPSAEALRSWVDQRALSRELVVPGIPQGLYPYAHALPHPRWSSCFFSSSSCSSRSAEAARGADCPSVPVDGSPRW